MVMVGLGGSVMLVVVVPGALDSTEAPVFGEQKAILPGGQFGTSFAAARTPLAPAQAMSVAK